MTRLAQCRANLSASCLSPTLWKRRTSEVNTLPPDMKWYVAEVRFEHMTGSKACSCLFHGSVFQGWAEGVPGELGYGMRRLWDSYSPKRGISVGVSGSEGVYVSGVVVGQSQNH